MIATKANQRVRSGPAGTRGEADLPRDLEIRFDRASRKIAKANTPAERERALDERAAVVDELARRSEMAWMEQVKREIEALEAARGGKVTVREEVVRVPVMKDGAPQIRRGQKVMRDERIVKVELSNRDGLEAMLEAGSITAMEYAVGVRYRGVFEAADPERGLTPPSPDRGGSGKGDPFGAKAIAVAHTRAKKGRDLLALDAIVFRARRDGKLLLKAEGVAIFRKVVGQGHVIRDLAFSGSVRARYGKIVSAGLAALADGWGLR
jgi:hypothetical protein